MRLYNPNSGAEFDTESDDEWHNNVYLEMGWLPAPDPEPAAPGRTVEPVVYAPVARETAVRSELEDKTKDELVSLAEERGLATSGTKADLIERLTGDPVDETE